MSKIRIKAHIHTVIDGTRQDLHLERVADMPYVPRVGDWLSFDPNDDFREVESFFWDSAEGFEVHLKEGTFTRRGVAEMVSRGWTQVEP